MIPIKKRKYKIKHHNININNSDINYKPSKLVIHTNPDTNPDTNSDVNNDECFICLEIYIDGSINTIKLNDMTNYIKNCYCNGFIHEKCFTKWHNIKPYCPICRSSIIFTKYEYCFYIFNNFTKNARIKILFCIKIIKTILLYLFYLWCGYKILIIIIKETPKMLN
jgi:hypothetical protein